MENDRSLAPQLKSCTENVKELTFIFSFAFKLEFIYRGQKIVAMLLRYITIAFLISI